jgi:hypothetical protein
MGTIIHTSYSPPPPISVRGYISYSQGQSFCPLHEESNLPLPPPLWLRHCFTGWNLTDFPPDILRELSNIVWWVVGACVDVKGVHGC